MKTHLSLACLAILLSLPASRFAAAQALPADNGAPSSGVGFSLPRVGGTLSYGLSASELISSGLYGGSLYTTTNLSGDLAYLSKSQYHPFSAVYDGGVLIANSGQQPTTFYQGLSFSQVLSTHRWNITLADSVSYLPQTPTTGLSGIPGTGDLGVDPISIGPNSGLGILTTYGPRVSNTTSGTVSRQLTAHLSAQASGSYGIQRFIGDNATFGVNSTYEGGSAGLSYVLSARDTIVGNYNYTNFSFSGSPYSFTAQGPTVAYTRQWTRRLVTNAYGGPQIIGGSSPLTNGTTVTVAGGASASYINRQMTYTLAYSRGANNGSGVVTGSISDSVVFAVHRQFARAWDVSGNLGYSRSVALPNINFGQYNSKGVSVAGQVTRALGRSFQGFASYNIQHQNVAVDTLNIAGLNSFNGTYQTFSIGISYSPRSILLGR